MRDDHDDATLEEQLRLDEREREALRQAEQEAAAGEEAFTSPSNVVSMHDASPEDYDSDLSAEFEAMGEDPGAAFPFDDEDANADHDESDIESSDDFDETAEYEDYADESSEGHIDDGGEVSDEEIAAFQKKKKKILLAAAAIAVLVIGGMAATLVLTQPTPPPPVAKVKPKPKPAPEPVQTTTADESLSTISQPALSVTPPGGSGEPSLSTAQSAQSAPTSKPDATPPVQPKIANDTGAPEVQVSVPSYMAPSSQAAANLQKRTSDSYSSDSPISFEEFVEVQEKTSSLANQLRELSGAVDGYRDDITTMRDNNNAAFKSLMAQMTELKSTIGALAAQINSTEQMERSLTDGRIRLGQFNVLDINSSGIATAHSPSGKRITLRRGEAVHIGPERLTVTGVYPNHDVVHLGERWFIDIRREEIGPEERTLRRELQAAKVAPVDDTFVSAGDGPGQLTISSSYEIRANVGNKVLLHNCNSRDERIFQIADEIPGHGRIRSIRAQEVVTDRSVFRYDACVTGG